MTCIIPDAAGVCGRTAAAQLLFPRGERGGICGRHKRRISLARIWLIGRDLAPQAVVVSLEG